MNHIKTYRRAIELLETRGTCKKRYVNSKGEICIAGALMIALGAKHSSELEGSITPLYHERAYQEMSDHLLRLIYDNTGVRWATLGDWNDEQNGLGPLLSLLNAGIWEMMNTDESPFC